MKKITIMIAALFISASVIGQTMYYLPAFPGNPRNLNTDPEETWATLDGLNLGWVGVQASSGTDVWSSTQTIPFSFSFYGTAKTQYKVSTTGVLTFELTATSVPSSSNGAIPSTSIPNNSICAWGLEVSGSNDYIASKTFGTAPNRQHWVSFLSASNPSSTKTNYTYWSIVLEETSNRVYVVDQLHRRAPGLTIGLQYNSSTAVSHPASPNVQNFAGGSKYADDNFYYAFVPGSLPSFDLGGLELISNDTIALTSAPFSIYGAFQNRGAITTQSVEVNYTIDGGTVKTANVTGLNVGKFTTGNILHPTMWNPGSTGVYDIKMWASKINNNVDADPSNDTISFTVTVVNSIGIDEDEVANFKLYPNPANNIINIALSGENNNYKIELVNMLGQTVLTSVNENNSNEVIALDVSTYESGIYMVKITIDGKTSTQKVTIQ